MKIYAVTIAGGVVPGEPCYWLREGPIYVAAHSYTEVEEKFRNSTRYKERKVAEILLLGDLFE
jgi:hypothetical protein